MKYIKNIRNVFISIQYMIKTSIRYNYRYLVLFIPAIVLTSVSPFIAILFPKWIIDSVQSQKEIGFIILLAIIMFSLRLIISFSTSLINRAQSLILMDINTKMRLDVIEKTMNIRYEYLETPEYIDLKGRAEKCIGNDYNISKIANISANFISSIIQIIGLISIISRVNILIFAVIIVIIIINSVVKSAEAKKTYTIRKKFSTLARKLFELIYISWDYKYAKDIRVYNLKDWLNEKKQRLYKLFSRGLVAEFMYTSITNLFRAILNVLQEGLFYAYLVYKFFTDNMTLGDFTMYLSAISQFSSCMESIMGSYVALYEASMYITDYRRYMELDELQQINVGKPPINFEKIEFKNVSFKYPNTDNYVLNNVSFTIKKGEKLSIVGDNGAGKTTLIKLLLRLYLPDSGSIFINGTNIENINYLDYAKLISVVFQDYQLFAFTVAENIAYNESQFPRISNVVKKIGIDKKIIDLPDGYDTFMSKEFSQSGIEFSGGEQQKIVIARALYKESSMVILDEPTSNLSPIAEYELYKDFDKIVEHKAVIYISHRMSSCRLCDKILLLDNGSVLEYGSHDELMRLDGKYKTMFGIQASHYV